MVKKKQELDDLRREAHMDEHQIPIDDLMTRYESNLDKGLTTQQAEQYLARDGPNGNV
jgi:sodium/potassium-transporting ATPase subunit alpha